MLRLSLVLAVLLPSVLMVGACRTTPAPRSLAPKPKPNAAAVVERFDGEFLNSLPLQSRSSIQDVLGNQVAGAVGSQGQVRLRGRTVTFAELEGFAMLSGRDGAESAEGNTESYDVVNENPYFSAAEAPLSTFSIDVDTASYANVRRFIENGRLPPPAAVRIEELVNYFRYDYPAPSGDEPFSTSVEMNRCPWNADAQLVRIGLRGKDIPIDKRPVSNLVFLIDVSGSMEQDNKLPLVKRSLHILVDQLQPLDRVAIVVYAGAAGVVLPSTAAEQRQTIHAAIDRLESGGSTNGGEGIALAYDLAAANRVTNGNNRVILATDGDFNVGVSSQGELVSLVQKRAKHGVFLSVLGFGMGNLKDSMMEALADHGDGSYHYIDGFNEAKRVLAEQLAGTLLTIAKDVKIQVEWNPAQVGAYRLVGYENRMLQKEDFNDDRKDAGEMGAGHTVTALYEVLPPGEAAEQLLKERKVDKLRYAGPSVSVETNRNELLTVKIRYKPPEGGESRKWEKSFAASTKDASLEPSKDFEFASAVATFGLLLRHTPLPAGADYDLVLSLAEAGLSKHVVERAAFANLVRKARVAAQSSASGQR
ncbi:MAG: VWA domain-containing protein [Deltaproteobacteria bacterium]|nr:VWA domain-containing protein [Deltaproteobacteria bacterium]